uniref:Uncharacterized protein n=1 Tax=Bionectria ochroleuca TaxID=29856 RepID=A0A8H7NDR8_BIOOC
MLYNLTCSAAEAVPPAQVGPLSGLGPLRNTGEGSPAPQSRREEGAGTEVLSRTHIPICTWDRTKNEASPRPSSEDMGSLVRLDMEVVAGADPDEKRPSPWAVCGWETEPTVATAGVVDVKRGI